METKTCSKCKQTKPVSEFYELHVPGKCPYKSQCAQCCREDRKSLYRRNGGYREQQKRWPKTHYHKLKSQVIEAYGGKCVCCGETNPAFLTIDHINGDGAEARRNGEGMGGSLYITLRQLGFPKDNYQLLCFNCNCSKRQNGACAHEVERQATCDRHAFHIGSSVLDYQI